MFGYIWAHRFEIDFRPNRVFQQPRLIATVMILGLKPRTSDVVDTVQDSLSRAFFKVPFARRFGMDVMVRHLPHFLACIIVFSNFGFAVCSGGSRQTSLAGYALSPDSSRIAAIAEDGTLVWWDVASGKSTQLLECVKPQAFAHPILFSPDSTRLAVAVDSEVHVFDIASGKLIARLTDLKLKEIYKITFSDDGRRIAASYEEGAVVWDLGSQSEIASVSAHPTSNALALNRDGTVLALGCWDGLQTWTVPNTRRLLREDSARRLADGFEVESVLFAHQDQWIVALTAAALPPEPKQRLLKFKREIAAWDSATGKKLQVFKADAWLDEQRFGLETGGAHLLLATDFKERLRAWDLETGALKSTWKTSSGHPSPDGRFLLREGGAPGRLELWEIGSADEKARAFTYRSPLCSESFADEKGNVKFENLFIADGVSDDEQPFGSLMVQGYVARDCTRVNVTHLKFETEERARQELDRDIAQALEVLDDGSTKDNWPQALLGQRKVLRFPGRGSTLGPFVVIWLQGTSLIEINSSSLPVALAMEKRMWEKN